MPCSDLKNPPAAGAPRPASPLPLGALAAGVGLSLLGSAALAQTVSPPPAADEEAQTLPAISVKAQTSRKPAAKEAYQAVTTTIGKGKQELRDIPQSVTVVTEKLLDDRNLTDLKDVLRTTAGITFMAGETGEEDVRLRGFSLAQAGDIYLDGMRDPSLYERDTFNNDRIEVLRGSASMLFGRGSTGGVVNQVSKQAMLGTQHEVEVTAGTGRMYRLTGDFNIQTGERSALRINAMTHEANNGGATVSKKGIAPTFRWGIGTADEFAVSLYHLEYDNNPTYSHPWLIRNGTIIPVLKADKFYGLASDYNRGSADSLTLSHQHRFADGGELKTSLRQGHYERDLLALNLGVGSSGAREFTTDQISDATILTRRESKGRIAATTGTLLQSDYSNAFTLSGLRHSVLAGADLSWDKGRRAPTYAQPTGTKLPATTVGTPNDGAWMPDLRGAPAFNYFTSRNVGLYAQDMVAITPAVKLIAGVRHDEFTAHYHNLSENYVRQDSLWSHRLGALYQPNDWASFHVSTGTSFNVSADAYQYELGNAKERAKTANTPPEKSRNVEIGSKLNLLDQRLSVNTSLFYAEKYNERNTDADSAATQQLLSGKRHATGMDFDIVGQITRKWEAYLSYTWIPEARIDASNITSGTAQRKGDRPALTPKHSASLWNTYQLTPQWRLGAGLNHRGSQSPEGRRDLQARDFTTLDLMAEYTIDWRTSVRLNVTNVTNELYADSLYRGFYAPGAARSAQLTLKMNF